MGVMTALLPTRADILATATRIAPYIRHTPILTVDAADFGLPGHRSASSWSFCSIRGRSRRVARSTTC